MAQRKPGRTTLLDVASLAGVDMSVVSRVVNRDPALNIREETRDRVTRAIASLQYRPNGAARSLRTDHANTLALFIPDHLNPVYAEIIVGAEAAAARHGYLLVTGSQEAVTASGQTYVDMLGNGRVDGILLAGGPVSLSDQAQLESTNLPWLHVNRRARGGERYVILDDALGAQTAVQHLVHLGHRSIGHIGGPTTADTARRRLQGWASALRQSKIDPKAMPVQSADYTPMGGASALQEMSRRGPLPTALFVANVASAIGVLHAAAKMSIDIPGELSVIALHDMPLASFLNPALTTVRMPLRQLGGHAVDLLITSGPHEPVTEVVGSPIDLIERESTTTPTRKTQLQGHDA